MLDDMWRAYRANADEYGAGEGEFAVGGGVVVWPCLIGVGGELREEEVEEGQGGSEHLWNAPNVAKVCEYGDENGDGHLVVPELDGLLMAPRHETEDCADLKQ